MYELFYMRHVCACSNTDKLYYTMLNLYRNKVYEAGNREKMNPREFCIRTAKITQFGRVARDEKRIP